MQRQSKRVLSIDGVRALAVLAIAACRTAPLEGLRVERLGIELFFVLSGYVYATALVNGEGWRTFYRKRALQILPLYAVVLLCILVGPGNAFPWWSLLTFNADVAMVGQSWFYPSAAVALWVICVEAKGIALLPWLLRKRRTLRLLIGLSMLSRFVISAECLLHVYPAGLTQAAETFFLCRLDGILLGAEAALLIKEQSRLLRAVPLVASLAVALRVALLWSPALLNGQLYPVIILPVGIVAGAALAMFLTLRSGRARLVSWWPLPWMGAVSCEVYLLHSAVAYLGSFSDLGVSSWQFCGETVFLTLILAAAFWFLFERAPLAGEGLPGDAPRHGRGGASRPEIRVVVTGSLVFVLLCHAAMVALSSLKPVDYVARNMYEQQARAFAHGQTALLDRPSPALLALPDPYDPRQREGLDVLHDCLLFRGNYYEYWGPFPALLLTPLELLPSRVRPRLPDALVTFAFAAILMGASAALLTLLRRLLAPESPAWTLAAWILVCGLAFPLTFCLAQPEIYEAAIIGGQAFLVLGLYFGLTGVVRERARDLLVAALCWSAAFATRASLAPAVAVLVLAVCFWLLRSRGPARLTRSLLHCVLICGPTSASVLLLLWYNEVRFGAPLDFGRAFQMSGMNVHELSPSAWQSIRYALPNLFHFTLQTMKVDDVFPFLHPCTIEKTPMLRPFMGVPGYGEEVCAGLLLYAPVMCLVPMALLTGGSWSPEVPPVVRRWLAPGLLLTFVLILFPVLVQFAVTMRYLVDLSYLLFILTAIGGWQVLQAARRQGYEGRATGLIAGLACFTCLIGLFEGTTGYHPRIHDWHSFLWDVAYLAKYGVG